MKIEFVLEKSQNKFVFWSNTEDISFFKKVIHTTFKQIRQSIEYQLKKIKRPQSQSIYDKFLKVHFLDGMEITKVLDMVYTLEPVAGKFAVALFLIGTLSAGLSSTFPIMMVAPLLIGDYRAGELDTKSNLFRILSGVACLIALTVPIIGANPIATQIATQV